MNLSNNYFNLIIRNSLKICIIFLYILKYFSFEHVITPVDGSYFKIIKISSEEYFILLKDGIYIYNNDFSINKKLYEFTDEEAIKNDKEFNIIIISKYINNNGFFILSLVNNILYLLDYNKQKLAKFNLTSDLTGDYYNILPYKLEYKSFFLIIIFTKKNCNLLTETKLNFLLYKIDISSNEYTINLENINNLEYSSYSCESINSFSCHIISNDKLICFYLAIKLLIKKVLLMDFDIQNNFQKGKENYLDIKLSEIKSIKTSLSKEGNQILFCSFYNTFGINYFECNIFNITNNKTSSIKSKCNYQSFYDIYYFEEEKAFNTIYDNKNNETSIIKINNNKNYEIKNFNFKENYNECQKLNNFMLYYNNNKFGFELLSECYTNNSMQLNILYDNFSNSSLSFNISEESRLIEVNESCNSEDFFNGLCQINNTDIKNVDEMIKSIREGILDGSLNNLLKDLINKEKENIIVKYDNIIYSITTSNTENKEKDENYEASIIKLGKCENILKNEYNISKNESLIIFSIEMIEKENLYHSVEYEIYSLSQKKALDLKYCKDEKIEIISPFKIDKNNLFKYNTSNKYYSDICYTYETEEGTDIPLEDRRKEFIDNNMSLCEENCELNSYNNKTEKVTCECFVKIKFPIISEITIDSKKIRKYFVDIKTVTNFIVMTCYHLLFSITGLKINIGSYLLLSIIFFDIILSAYFIFKEYKLFNVKIRNIIKIQTNCIELNKNLKFEEKKIEDKSINSPNSNFPSKKYIKKKKKKKKVAKTNYIKTSGDITGKTINIIKDDKDLSKDEQKLTILLNKNYIVNNNLNSPCLKLNDTELNSLTYQEALENDKRNYFQYYFSLIKMKHIIIFTFYTNTDYNSKIIKIILFLFIISLYFTVNSFFFTYPTMHKIYEDKGNFNFIYQIPQIIYSNIISNIITIIVTYFSLTEKNIIEIKKIKQNEEDKITKILKFIKIRFISFFIINYLLILLFWYYIACFCAVYKNTQIHLIKDILISYTISFIFPFFTFSIISSLRFLAMKAKNKDKECLYKISKFLYFI